MLAPSPAADAPAPGRRWRTCMRWRGRARWPASTRAEPASPTTASCGTGPGSPTTLVRRCGGEGRGVALCCVLTSSPSTLSCPQAFCPRACALPRRRRLSRATCSARVRRARYTQVFQVALTLFPLSARRRVLRGPRDQVCQLLRDQQRKSHWPDAVVRCGAGQHERDSAGQLSRGQAAPRQAQHVGRRHDAPRPEGQRGAGRRHRGAHGQDHERGAEAPAALCALRCLPPPPPGSLLLPPHPIAPPDNEFVVYNLEQIRMRYLVKLKFHYG